MNNTASTIPILLFAKAPVAGDVKTRLQPSCTASQAADIAKILLEESIRKATSYWGGSVILCVWPDMDNDFIQIMARRYPITLVNQSKGDLGEKMADAFEVYGYPAAIMGCDVPHISAQTLRDAYLALVAKNNVLGRSEDGGYYLIGLSSSHPEVFDGIDWGSNKVYEATIKIAKRQSLGFQKLPQLNDVDTWQDVRQTAPLLPALSKYMAEQELL